ncbi:MAG: glycosyltransferase, partial [Verrucomicrobia bacterium]
MSADQPDFLLSFVVPLYNTGRCIVKLFDAFRDLPIPGGYELILVNDASQDDTYARAKAIIPS